MSSNGYAEDRNKKSKILGGILIAVIIILIVTLAFIGYKMLNPKKESPEVEQQTEQKVLSGSGQKSNSAGGELSSIETSSKSKAKKKLEDYEITQLTLDHPVNLSFKSNFNELNKDNQKDKDDK